MSNIKLPVLRELKSALEALKFETSWYNESLKFHRGVHAGKITPLEESRYLVQTFDGFSWVLYAENSVELFSKMKSHGCFLITSNNVRSNC